MEMASLREILEASDRNVVLTKASSTTPSPTTIIKNQKTPEQSTFGLAFTDSEFKAPQERIKTRRQNRQTDVAGGMKLFPWLRADQHTPGLKLDGLTEELREEIDREQMRARRYLADPELDTRIFIFSLDLDAVSDLASRYPYISLRSFTIIKRRLKFDKNAIMAFLRGQVDSRWRGEVLARLRRDSGELRETLENVRRHIEGTFNGTSAILDDSDSNYDTDSDESGDEEYDDEDEDERDENESGSRRGFNWLTILGTEEERFGN